MGVSTAALAQLRPATEAEIELIRDAFMLDQITEWKHYEVLDVRGAFTDPTAAYAGITPVYAAARADVSGTRRTCERNGDCHHLQRQER